MPAAATTARSAHAWWIVSGPRFQLADRIVRQRLAERNLDGADRRVVLLLISATARDQFTAMIKLQTRALAVVTEALDDN